MEYRIAEKELDEIIILLNDRIIAGHEDAMALVREELKDSTGTVLIEKMENEHQNLKHLSQRMEVFLRKMEKAERGIKSE